MAHQTMEKTDAVFSGDRQDAALESIEQPSGSSDRLGRRGKGLHGGHYNMAVSGAEPKGIERIGDSGLKVSWTDGHESLYPWLLLRTECPCAACREGGPVHPDPKVQPLEVKPVGRYAFAVRWSDGHATGIFSFEYLRSICPCEACRPSQFTEG